MSRSVVVALAAALLPQVVAAQTDDAWLATRADLQREAQQARQLATSPAYGERLRATAAVRAAALEARLRSGDFRNGDRIEIRVSGLVTVLDTVTVTEGPRIAISQFGEMELRGVLRSELRERLLSFVRASVLEATVEVTPLLRVAVFGSVSGPGYFAVSGDTRLDELLAYAGGPTTDADPLSLKVRRGEAVVLDGDDVRSAIASGTTIHGLGIREGDFLSVDPRRAPWDRGSTLQLLGIIGTPLLTFLLLR